MLRKLSIALVYISALTSVLAQAPAPDPTARMQQIIQSYVDNKQFMGTILVVKDGKTLINQGYGSADLEWSIPNTPSVKFRLGSLTKQFTAAYILLLAERGKLNIEDPIGKYLPDAPLTWKDVTIYNLLTHTSGVPSFTGFPDYRTTNDATREVLGLSSSELQRNRVILQQELADDLPTVTGDRVQLQQVILNLL